jgi:hypothetical protein
VSSVQDCAGAAGPQVRWVLRAVSSGELGSSLSWVPLGSVGAGSRQAQIGLGWMPTVRFDPQKGNLIPQRWMDGVILARKFGLWEIAINWVASHGG